MKLSQRRYDRASTKLDLEYSLESSLSSSFKQASCEDVGFAGVRAIVSENLDPGSRIWMKFKASEDSCWTSPIEGLVIWQKRISDSNHNNPTGIFISPDQVAPVFYFDSLLKVRTGSLGEGLGFGLSSQIEPAYDGSRVTFKMLRMFGWGPLNNLGYFRFGSPFSIINIALSFLSGHLLYLLPDAQRRLIMKCIAKIKPQKGEKILDIACGKGLSSFIVAGMNPECFVTGIDILSRNIYASKAVYGGAHNLQYLSDNAMNLNFPSEHFDKVACIEAAFHFNDKAKFIEEVYRSLKPGGKFLLVDFMWRSEKDRVSVDDEKANLVKREWEWSDFFTCDEYKNAAKKCGFKIENWDNWDSHVSNPLEFTFQFIAALSKIDLGRLFLKKVNPTLKSITEIEWRHIQQSADAHDYLRNKINYIAVVFQKPSNG